jgi:hypothetical protein
MTSPLLALHLSGKAAYILAPVRHRGCVHVFIGYIARFLRERGVLGRGGKCLWICTSNVNTHIDRHRPDDIQSLVRQWHPEDQDRGIEPTIPAFP